PFSPPHDPTTPAPSTLSLHDALPIFPQRALPKLARPFVGVGCRHAHSTVARSVTVVVDDEGALAAGSIGVGEDILVHRAGREYRSEEHTSELQSRSDLVCRLLLEKKK